jgi:serine/threonine-protein kinase
MLAYLIFLIIFSAAVSILVIKLRLPAPRLVIPLLILAIIAPLAGYYFIESYFSSIPIVVIPNLTGESLEQAGARLSKLGLTLEEAGDVYDPTLSVGTVVSQRPAAGKKVKAGRTIKLFLSSGTRKVLVPNLLGRPADQVEVVLLAEGLTLGKIEEDDSLETNSGIILSQNPLPGEEVAAGTSVEVSVSAQAQAKKNEGGFKLW